MRLIADWTLQKKRLVNWEAAMKIIQNETESRKIGEKINGTSMSCGRTYSILISNYSSRERRKGNSGLNISRFYEN